MRILLIDIVRTSLEEVWPSVENSLGLMYLSAAAKQRFGDRIDVRVRTLISKPKLRAQESGTVRAHLETWEPDVVGIRPELRPQDHVTLTGPEPLGLVISDSKKEKRD